VAAGIDVLVFITGRTKRSITDHFDKAYELETEMEQRGKEKMLDLVRGILPAHVSCVYIRQAEALGLGHAVGCARPVVGEDPFAVILADDLVDGQGSGGALKQMVDIYDRFGCSVLGVEEVPPDETHKYGVVTPEEIEPDLWAVKAIVEKPDPKDAPSNMAVVGRYILTPRIFDLLEQTSKGAGGEIQLTDAIAALLKEEQVLAHRFKGKRYDCGSKLGYLQATVEYALKHPELRDEFGAYINTLCADRLTGS
jgi:UTP--glucose-1-phosphate uridylyltransferase